VPIGPPIAGTWLAIVGSSGQVVPEGVEGQLILGGPNVASGYLGDRQADRFTTHEQFQGLPPSCTGPAFRTGDACKVVGSTVLFAGRVDDQLNVGGARVEPQEIESAVAQLDAVTAVVVVAVDTRPLDVLLASATQEQAAAAMRQAADTSDPQRALATALQSIGRADYRLVAHYASQPEIPSADLRAACAALPTSHRPSIFSHHQELPQLPNGKLDRSTAAHLPLPAVATSTTAGVGATPAMQQLFAEVLHLDSVGVDQSFFDLGGDSLRALELLRLIEARTGARLPTSAVHNAPTPAELAILSGGFGASEVDAGDNTIVMRLQPEGSQTPIFALHNLGVDGAMWRPMSGYLGNDHPMYGIADPFALLDPFGDNYNLEHRPEIHETAARYVDHIERLAPTGPIVLLGFCLGGVFGYEVAQQLHAKGRTVENFIIVLACAAPGVRRELDHAHQTELPPQRQVTHRAYHGCAHPAGVPEEHSATTRGLCRQGRDQTAPSTHRATPGSPVCRGRYPPHSKLRVLAIRRSHHRGSEHRRPSDSDQPWHRRMG
jgi:enterobactin synthetase component F